jgi:CheY-like chemotaxis protein
METVDSVKNVPTSPVDATRAHVVQADVFDAFNRTFLDLLPGAVYFCDQDGVVVHWNRRAAELWGREPNGQRSERFCGSHRLYRPDGTFMPAEHLLPAAENGEAQSGAARSSDCRLLVVDDNADAALSLATLLRLQGHAVKIAHDGSAAVDIAVSWRPNLVFLDLGMPGMDGYQVAHRLREQPGLEKVVLAALTGWGQPDDRRRTSEAGFDHHLVKPVEPTSLETILAGLRQTP